MPNEPDHAGAPVAEPSPVDSRPRAELSLTDAVAIIVGTVVGAGIYQTTPAIAANVPSGLALAGVWIAGGAVALIGALCYAELATTYPSEGGDYVYLSRAMGSRVGFLFSWSLFWIARPGSIGMMAFVFATYAKKLLAGVALIDSFRHVEVALAAAPIVVLTGLNVVGVRFGAATQVVLTAVKVVGLLAVVGAAFWSGPAGAEAVARIVDSSNGESPFPPMLGLAIIFVMYTYGGWNDIAFVAGEIRDPRRNLVRALVLGVLAVAAIYLLVTFAFVRTLTLDGVRHSQAVAADTLAAAVGDWAGAAISALICISTLGVINAMLLTGSRVYYAVGTQHRTFALLGVWNPRRESPVRSLVVQAAVTLAVVVGFGSYENGFERMFHFTTPVFWLFLLLTGVALFILRRKKGEPSRAFHVPGYPITPLVFCASCLFMLYSSIDFALSQRSPEAAWAVGLFLAGIAASFIDRPTVAR